MAMRWKKDPKPTGLARVTAGPRGSELRLEKETTVARVQALPQRNGYVWFWVAGWGHPEIPHVNSSRTPNSTEAEAKAAAMRYVRQCLSAAAKSQSTKGGD